MWKIRKFSLQSEHQLMTTRMIDKILTNWGHIMYKIKTQYQLTDGNDLNLVRKTCNIGFSSVVQSSSILRSLFWVNYQINFKLLKGFVISLRMSEYLNESTCMRIGWAMLRDYSDIHSLITSPLTIFVVSIMSKIIIILILLVSELVRYKCRIKADYAHNNLHVKVLHNHYFCRLWW